MARTKKTAANVKQAKAQSAGEMCELLCDEIEDHSNIQARVLRGVYREKLSRGDLIRASGLRPDRLDHELAQAHKTALRIMSGGALEEWASSADFEGRDVLGSAAEYDIPTGDRLDGSPPPDAA